MTLPTIRPEEARRLAENGARLVDIRSPDEYARLRAPGARSEPLDTIGPQPEGGPTIFLCRSGMRTRSNADRLAALCSGEAYVLEGGLEAWRRSGLPVEEDRSQPLELMRQVQIAAGSLVLLGVLLGFLVAPAWFGIAGFVGAGLLFAGLTGTCGMANLLSVMPWNRRSAS